MAVIDIRKAPDGKISYRVRVRVKGFPTQTATFARKTDANTWAQKTESDLKLGKHIPLDESKKRTLSELIKRYTLTELPKRKTDQKKYAQMLQFWDKHLGKNLLRDLSPAKIAEIRELLTNEPMVNGKRRAAQTVKHYLNALSACLVWATRELAWLDENPLNKVKKPSTARNGRLRFLSDEERIRLLTACKESASPSVYPLVILALTTGARWSELLTLKWEHVDFKKHSVHFLDTKNGDSRSVPLGSEALKELKKLKQNGAITPGHWVFPSKDGLKAAYPRDAWEAAVKKSGVENFKFHDLRHTAASYLAMGGASLLEIGHILGHRTAQMTRRYAHLTDSHTRGAIDRLDQHMFREAQA